MAFRAVAPRPVQGLQTPQRQTVGVRPAATAAAVAAKAGTAAATTTPTKATPATAVITDSPGNWRHPRMDEITQRRAATVFTEANLKTAVYNGLAFFLVFLAQSATGPPFKQLARLVHSVVPPQHSGLLAALIYAVLGVNIVRALLPLFRQPDNLADVPLTPSQRKLLGLPALKTPGTPNAVYTTPPRYTRTPSVSGSAASVATATRGSGSGNDTSFSKSFSGSPISGSPLFPKARNANSGGGAASPFSPGSPFQNTRKASFGSPGSLPGTLGGTGAGGSGGASLFSDSTLSSLPGTLSPTSGKRLSMGLNNKWLYEKGRRSSGGARIY